MRSLRGNEIRGPKERNTLIKSGIISSLLVGEVRVAEGGQPDRRTVTGRPSVSDREIWQATDTGKSILMRDRSWAAKVPSFSTASARWSDMNWGL